MLDKSLAVMAVSPGPTLRWVLEELRRRYNYRLVYATSPHEAGSLLENTCVDALVCEVAPSYTSDCRLLREVSHRSRRLPVFLFVEPEGEDYLFDESAHGTFYVIRPTVALDRVHVLLQEGIARSRQRKAA